MDLLKNSDFVLGVLDLLDNRLIVVPIVLFLSFVFTLLFKPFILDFPFNFGFLPEELVLLVKFIVLTINFSILFQFLDLFIDSLVLAVLHPGHLSFALLLLITHVCVAFVHNLALLLLKFSLKLPTHISQLHIELISDLLLFVLE